MAVLFDGWSLVTDVWAEEKPLYNNTLTILIVHAQWHNEYCLSYLKCMHIWVDYELFKYKVDYVDLLANKIEDLYIVLMNCS